MSCATGTYIDNTAFPCPSCVACNPNCTYPYVVNSSDPCSCAHCEQPTCGAGSTQDPENVCSCMSCTIECAGNTTKQTPASENPLCDPCVACSADCPSGQVPVDPADQCSGCALCPTPTCNYGKQLSSDGCECVACAAPSCAVGQRLSSSGCGCDVCNDTVCEAPLVVDSTNPCQCISLPTTTPQSPRVRSMMLVDCVEARTERALDAMAKSGVLASSTAAVCSAALERRVPVALARFVPFALRRPISVVCAVETQPLVMAVMEFLPQVESWMFVVFVEAMVRAVLVVMANQTLRLVQLPLHQGLSQLCRRLRHLRLWAHAFLLSFSGG